MHVRLCEPESSWYCEIILEPHEWPALDKKGDWMDRHIRRWVYENCYPGTFFAAEGWILFQEKEDAISFYLAWNQPQ